MKDVIVTLRYKSNGKVCEGTIKTPEISDDEIKKRFAYMNKAKDVEIIGRRAVR